MISCSFYVMPNWNKRPPPPLRAKGCLFQESRPIWGKHPTKEMTEMLGGSVQRLYI
jgi:hypothetical protein